MRRIWTWLVDRPTRKQPHFASRPLKAEQLETRDVPSATDVVTGILSSAEAKSLVVDQVYQQLLDRPADAAGSVGWVGALQNGLTQEQFEARLAASDEYFALNGGTTEGYINGLYQDFLNRPAEADAVAAFSASLSKRATNETIALAIATSGERYAIEVGGVYQRFLGRVPEASEVAAWVGPLTQGLTITGLTRAVAASDEFQQINGGDARGFIGGLYQLLLGRTASEEEFPGWVTVFNTVTSPAPGSGGNVLTSPEVDAILRRASAATPSQDAIVAVVDRNGRILGVAVENGVASNIQADPQALTFAIDGAVAKARTGAFFANDQGPLTSRTVRDLSQTTMTQREIEANPNDTDPNSTLRGPGFVAPIGIASRFPINVANSPPVDLFAIEHTNRDSIVHPGPDRIKGTADDIQLLSSDSEFGLPRGRFDIDPTFVPAGQTLFAPESYGFQSGLAPNSQSRGIATTPGGIPLYKNGRLVGGIGVFFPGLTGFATAENSAVDITHNPALPDRSFEAEWIAFSAAGGVPGLGLGVSNVGGEPPLPGISIPSIPPNRIDLVGITLSIFGPTASNDGPRQLLAFGRALGTGTAAFRQMPVTPQGNTSIDGRVVPEGWLVAPHNGVTLTAAEVQRAIMQGVNTANITRAAIRLPLNQSARMVFAVADVDGEILGLFRMADATVFSIDVAVAKARNVAYYANASLLQPGDQLPGIPPGVAMTNRTFRFVTLPRFPSGAEGTPPAPFSILTDGGVDPRTGLQVGPRLPASAFDSVQGRDAFNPGSNFFYGGSNPSPDVIRNQNGIVFFPGSVPLYRVTGAGSLLVGGLGVSGDGVDQDDVVTAGGAVGLDVMPGILRADDVFINGVRLPYQKANRNPFGL